MNQPKPKQKRKIVGGIGYRDYDKSGPTLDWYKKRIKAIAKEMRASDQRDDAAKRARAPEIGALVARDRTEIAHEAMRAVDARRDAEETRQAVTEIYARLAPPTK
jgi:methylmalonyl-CoA mutase N-terminal domain/subunit